MIRYNPLDILKKRKLSFMPPHFGRVSHCDFITEDLIRWIDNKLEGRYSITNIPSIDSDGKLKSQTFIGFEDHKELTYFMLACPFIRRK